jgi:glutamyl-tRNA reductase
MKLELYICGINYKTAPLNLRERAALLSAQPEPVLQAMQAATGAREVCMLTTCNRCEWYWIGANPDTVMQWLQQHYQFATTEWDNAAYLYQAETALQHAMEVACGLDSMMLGEPQVLGQMKAAFQQAYAVQLAGKQLQQIFNAIFTTAKKVRTHTSLGSKPASIAYAAASLATYIFNDLPSLTVLLVGAGDTIELVAKHLHKFGVTQFIAANRTLANAQTLLARYQGLAITIEQIPAYLSKADIVVTATASTLPLITRHQVAQTMPSRRRPLHLIDLAMPRNIEADSAKLEGVYLYNIDDLQHSIAKTQSEQTAMIITAKHMITEQVAAFSHHLEGRKADPMIRAYRTKIEQFRDLELEKALRALENGALAEDVINRLAYALTNKFLHEPTTLLRSASQQPTATDLISTLKRWLTPETV